jgi:hypothetical protein
MGPDKTLLDLEESRNNVVLKIISEYSRIKALRTYLHPSIDKNHLVGLLLTL